MPVLSSNFFDSLSIDIVIEILRFLPLPAYARLSLLSKQCQLLVSSSHPAIWRHQLVNLDPFKILDQKFGDERYVSVVLQGVGSDWRELIKLLKCSKCQRKGCEQRTMYFLVGMNGLQSGRCCVGCEREIRENGGGMGESLFENDGATVLESEDTQIPDMDEYNEQEQDYEFTASYNLPSTDTFKTIMKKPSSRFLFLPNEYLFPALPTCIVDPLAPKRSLETIRKLGNQPMSTVNPIKVSSIAEALALEREGEHIKVYRGTHQYGSDLHDATYLKHPYDWIQPRHKNQHQEMDVDQQLEPTDEDFDATPDPPPIETRPPPYLANLVPVKIVGETIPQYLHRTFPTTHNHQNIENIPLRPLITNENQCPLVCYSSCILENLDIRTGISTTHSIGTSRSTSFPTIEICRHSILRDCRIESTSLCGISAYLLQESATEADGDTVRLVIQNCEVTSLVKNPAIMFENVSFVGGQCFGNRVSAVEIFPVWHFDQYVQVESVDLKVVGEVVGRLEKDGNVFLSL
ncbi:hypothetical protein HK098_005952 [Nowakowskiella sp. JEL0407]|nr:hypothetical protein HK098_005952 [Nowakowskiella sp. JEL0407]